MELNKTRCLDCGYTSKWYSYKGASTPERKEHNRKNSMGCARCGSTNVTDVINDEIRGPYKLLSDTLEGKKS